MKTVKSKIHLKLTVLGCSMILSACQSFGSLPFVNSLEEREKAAYEAVVKEPNDENINRYMELAEKLQQKQAQEAKEEADKATHESDKEFIKYFKKYGRTDIYR